MKQKLGLIIISGQHDGTKRQTDGSDAIKWTYNMI